MKKVECDKCKKIYSGKEVSKNITGVVLEDDECNEWDGEDIVYECADLCNDCLTEVMKFMKGEK